MSNYHEALKLIGEVINDELPSNQETAGVDEVIAEALAEAGLIAPDLPGPDLARDDPQWIADHRETWEADYGDDYETPDVWNDAELETSLSVFPTTGGGMIHPTYDGETHEPVTASEARRIGMKWLAAANAVEGKSA